MKHYFCVFLEGVGVAALAVVCGLVALVEWVES